MMHATTKVRQEVNKLLATGVKAKTIRTLWYKIKHEMKPWQGQKSEKEHADYVNGAIGEYLWKLFLKKDPYIYLRLGLQSKAIQWGSYPVILFCEKDLGIFDFLKGELNQFTYLSSGQIPSYEISLLAEYIKKHDFVYIATSNDLDPAGFNITENLVKKLGLALDALGSQADLIHLPINIEDPFQYETYTLAENQAKKWHYGPLGVELDAIPMEVLEEATVTALDAVSNALFEKLATDRKRSELFEEMLAEDEEYQRINTELEERSDQIQDEVDKIELHYNQNHSYTHKKVLVENVQVAA